jgi:hypothetical protein
MENKMYEVEFDYMITEMSIDDWALWGKYNVSIKCVNPCGPGGGNPVIVARGTRADLEKFIKTDGLWEQVSVEDIQPVTK